MDDLDIEGLRAMRKQKEEEGRERRAIAAADYPEARALAATAGLTLVCHPPGVHYTLSYDPGGWEIHLYPGNQRIYPNKMKRWAPHLAVSYPWRLEDAVRLAIQTIGAKS